MKVVKPKRLAAEKEEEERNSERQLEYAQCRDDPLLKETRIFGVRTGLNKKVVEPESVGFWHWTIVVFFSCSIFC